MGVGNGSDIAANNGSGTTTPIDSDDMEYQSAWSGAMGGRWCGESGWL